MSQAHPTVEAEQAKTDTWLVIDPAVGIGPNRELLGRVEVPRYSQPNANGVRLDREKRLSLAVARVIEREGTEVRAGDGGVVPTDRLTNWSFEVLTGLDEDAESVQYEQNPAFDGVWNPEGDGA